MIKGSNDREDIIIRNTYASNSVPKTIKQKLTELKGHTDNSTITVGEFNTPLCIITTRQEIIRK